MPIQQFFEELVQSLRDFLAAPGEERLRVVLTHPDAVTITRRLIAGLERDDTVAAVLVPSDAPFTDAATFFRRLYADLDESYRPFAGALEAEHVLGPPAWESLHVADPAERFARGAAMFANALPQEVGAVAFVIDPGKVADPVGYRQALKHLVRHTPSEWVKYIVLDDRLDGHLVELVTDEPGVSVQSMHLPPAEIEARAKKALDLGRVSVAEQRVYTGLLASFASARNDHAAALALYRRQMDLTRATGTPNDLPPVYYNLGTAHLAAGDATAAVEALAEGLTLAARANQTAVMPMLLTNLGVALFRGGATAQAVESFTAARTFAQKLNQPPTEAHVLDSLAKCHAAANRPADAERCWNEAGACYDRITAPAMAEARVGGKKLILMQLEQHYASTRQAAKLAAVRKELSGGNS